jgi:hypothetical protein
MKVGILVFILGVLTAGSVVARETGESFSPTPATAEAGFNLEYVNNQIDERAIDERIIDRFVSFEPSDGGSSRYSMSLDLEREDGDWNIEVTVTMEF